jgi:DNA-binding MarR family transcriptional regulator
MKNSLHYLLRVAQTNCHKQILSELSVTGLNPGQPKVLEFLAEKDGCEQKEIAIGCDLEPATVTGILGRMEQADLIYREKKDGNRRSLFVYLTEKGKSALLEVEKAFITVEQEAWNGIPAEEQTLFLKNLAKIYENLKLKEER